MSGRTNDISLKNLSRVLKGTNKRGIINTLTIQNKDINSKYKYTLVSFKINRIDSELTK